VMSKKCPGKKRRSRFVSFGPELHIFGHRRFLLDEKSTPFQVHFMRSRSLKFVKLKPLSMLRVLTYLFSLYCTGFKVYKIIAKEIK
jgi:hypothetical protein